MNAQRRKRRKRHPWHILRRILRRFEKLIERIEACLDGHSCRIRVRFSIGPIGDRLRIESKGGEKDKMKVTLTDIQGFSASVGFRDAKENPATVIAPPTWTASDPDLLTVTASEDGLSATVVAKGPLGVGQVVLSADGGPNAGDDPISGILDVEVVSSKATAAVFSTTPPEDQPQP